MLVKLHVKIVTYCTCCNEDLQAWNLNPGNSVLDPVLLTSLEPLSHYTIFGRDHIVV